MHFDCALYMAAYFSQNMVTLRSVRTCQHVCVCAELRLEFNGHTIAARLVS